MTPKLQKIDRNRHQSRYWAGRIAKYNVQCKHLTALAITVIRKIGICFTSAFINQIRMNKSMFKATEIQNTQDSNSRNIGSTHFNTIRTLHRQHWHEYWYSIKREVCSFVWQLCGFGFMRLMPEVGKISWMWLVRKSWPYKFHCTSKPGLWSRSPSNFGWLEPEPKTFRWWSRSLKFGFRFHGDSLWVKQVVI